MEAGGSVNALPALVGEGGRVVRRVDAETARGNLLFLRPGTREHFLEHLAEDWPELLPRYEELYRRRAYLGSAETKPIRTQVSTLARALGVADRRLRPLEPKAPPEQLVLAV